MYTKKKVVETCTRLVNLLAISLCFLRENWYIPLAFFGVTLLCFWVFPFLVTKIVLGKEDQKEIDGELFLWTAEGDDKIDYRLTLNAINTIPFKEYLKIKVNENAQDESIK